ncbi:MAG: diguanylate cyclase [Actinomycetota bacterium]
MEEDRLEEAFLEALDRVNEKELQDKMRDYLEQYHSRIQRLEQQALRDRLTGLFNRHCLEDEFGRMARNHTVISLLIIDIDYFKSVNDRFGHDTGDRVLQAMATFITDAARGDDACFRYGGEEFLVLLPGTDSQGALRFAERLRSVIADRTLEIFTVPITASFGIAESPRHSRRLDELLHMADRALYKAKHGGRNRTVVFEGDAAVTVPPGGAVSPGPGASHLPQQPTAFIGREKELTEIASLLGEEDCRLLTLVGPGGIGKTRLALEAAMRAEGGYPHGAYFFPGSQLSSPQHLVSALAVSLDFSFYAEGEALAQLLDFLREKKLLLVMDSFERFIEEGSLLLARILEAAPQAKIMVTSQERLNLKGEWILEVGGMDVPDDERGFSLTAPDEFDAINLFLHGARRVYPGITFTMEERPLIGDLCRFLEGMPLGIELASPWIRFLPLKEICEEIAGSLDFLSTTLRDIPERHRSLRVAFEYSWNLLKPEERLAFARMSVFRGGFRREAGEEVAGAPLALITALMDKSLLRRGSSGRYEMHGVLRSYAGEKLGEGAAEEERVRDAFCSYYLRLLQACESEYLRARQVEALAALEDDIENIREAWKMAVQGMCLEELNRSVSSLYLFYDIKAWLEEGEKLLGELVAAVRASAGEGGLRRRIEEELVARAVTRQGCLALRMGMHEKASELLDEGLRILRGLDMQEEVAFNLIFSGMLSERTGDYARASGLYRESLDIYRELDNRRGVATALLNQAIHSVVGYEEARKLYLESLEIYRELGDLRGMSISINNLGVACFYLGEYEEAKRHYEESLAIDRRLGDRRGIAIGLVNLGEVAGKLGRREEARELCGQGLEDFREIGDRRGMASTLSIIGQLAMDQDDPVEAASRFREALAVSEEIGAVPLSLNTMAQMALLLEKRGEKERSHEVICGVLSQEGCDVETRNLGEGLRDRLAFELPAPACKQVADRAGKRSREDLAREMLERS